MQIAMPACVIKLVSHVCMLMSFGLVVSVNLLCVLFAQSTGHVWGVVEGAAATPCSSSPAIFNPYSISTSKLGLVMSVCVIVCMFAETKK